MENLRIGGYQRLALDQSYCLSDMGIPVRIVLMSPRQTKLKNFDETESNLILKKRLSIFQFTGNRLKDFFSAAKILRENNQETLIISHSLRSSVLFTLARLGTKNKIVINTTIHQLPSLSKYLQRQKRFLYAQFTDNLLAYSVAVMNDWSVRFPLGKKIKLLRNGIYLDRLPAISSSNEISTCVSPRLIYLGRNTSWKGISTYFDFLRMEFFSEFSGLMMISGSNPEIEAEVKTFHANRILILEGANLAHYKPSQRDLHIYPAQYGPEAQYIEPISLNCLEMAAMGVRSLVTFSKEETWPELRKSGIFIPVDWKNPELQEMKIFPIDLLTGTDYLEHIRNTVSIARNIEEHLTYLSIGDLL